MKNILAFVITFCVCLLCSNEIQAKKIKIVTTPETAKIYVDGNYVADGSYVLNFKKKDDFFTVKVEAPGYVEKTLRVYKQDTRKSIPIDLRKDESFEVSVSSSLANRYFTVNVREGVNEDQAWKLLAQVVLNYFEELKTSDKSSGFMTTPWKIDSFSNVKIRTMVQIKEITNDGLAYQIRISSESAPIDAVGDYGFKPWDRILKRYEPLINEMQQRLGQN
mgnify:FL=1